MPVSAGAGTGTGPAGNGGWTGARPVARDATAARHDGGGARHDGGGAGDGGWTGTGAPVPVARDATAARHDGGGAGHDGDGIHREESMTGYGHGEQIRPSTVLPARRSAVTLRTADGLGLVGELALPAARDPVATLICLHPLPTQGGMMDSHLLRKAANRLPALADLAVLRFNTRGTTSDHGTSDGEFGAGGAERHDVAAAVAYAVSAGLPERWLLGWSFGTELALMWGNVPEVTGALLLSPPLRRAADSDLDAWAASGQPLIALVPEFDDYLRPDEARQRFARVPQAEVVAVAGGKHLWVGEPYVRVALNEIVKRVNPAAWPLPTEWKKDPS
jgi:alpha/beta superfamily hydrolase